MKPRKATRRGFSLIELLALLTALSMLVATGVPVQPAVLQQARRPVCANNLRLIARTAIEYAMENDDWIIGSPAGSGAYLQGHATAFGPAVQTWDFMGPMLHRWEPAAPLPAQGDVNGVIDRFNEIRSHRNLLDRTNHFEALHFAGPNAGTGPMISYNTSRNQLWRDTDVPSSFPFTLPAGWRPSVTAMGDPANKVFCADGGRFSTPTISPDYDLGVNSGFGGAFADDAPYATTTRSWNRVWAPGNRGRTGIDARIYAYRHSTVQPPPGAEADVFKMNLVFYDGHVERQGDLTSSNPEQWLPQGTVLQTQNVWRDTRIAFQLAGVITIGG